MKRWIVVALCALTVGCASAPRITKAPERLFDDRLFAAPSVRISVDDVFAVNDEMRRYLDTEIAHQIPAKGRQKALFDALYAKNQLKLEYDATTTRNAGEAFAARSGNCLSLVIMTAAFAKQLDLPVHYQSAYQEETWSRIDDTHFFIGHVNLTLGRRPLEQRFGTKDSDAMTIDFIPPLDNKAIRTREIPERTVVAMYMNNRAAEALTRGELDDAYAWSRAAIDQDPSFVSAYNTLGVVYQRHGSLQQALSALEFAHEHEPANTHVMSNLALVLNALGRESEAKTLAATLERLDPDPPFAFFYRGIAAMTVRDYEKARDLFAREVDRAPYYHEFRFWLAAAYVGLGQPDKARKHLELAIEYSTNRRERDVYAAKLDRISSKLH
jgi:tetratricopeptide (TPR) repeat protein